MYFDFEDHRPDTPTIARPMSPREVILITVNLHLVVLVAILLGPRIPFVQRIIEARQAEQEVARQQELERQKQEAPRFVFMQPRMERPTPPPKRAELSDIDRRARSVERAPDPSNPLPFSRGNTTERIDRAPDPEPGPAGGRRAGGAGHGAGAADAGPRVAERIPAVAGTAAAAAQRVERRSRRRHPERAEVRRRAKAS